MKTAQPTTSPHGDTRCPYNRLNSAFSEALIALRRSPLSNDEKRREMERLRQQLDRAATSAQIEVVIAACNAVIALYPQAS